MYTPGQRLRMLREQLGLTIRDVETASARIAERHSNPEFVIPISRLSEIETKGNLPSIYRLYSLAIVYRRDLREILAYYGVDLNDTAPDLALAGPARRSHVNEALAPATSVRVPVKIDPGFDPRQTVNLGRFVEQWGVLPLTYLAEFAADNEFIYGYIGTDDFTMYPILPPGAFLQIDESKNKVVNGVWQSEYQRPIYFVETRDGYTCAWCTLKKDQLILQPHPLSPTPVRLMRHPQEAEIVGQVVGIAMKLDDWQPCAPSPETRSLSELN